MRYINVMSILLVSLMWMTGEVCLAMDTKTAEHPSVNTEFILADTVDTGCCVFLTPDPVCVVTNKSYCETRAKKDKLEHQFHGGKNCKQVPQCK